MSVQVTFAGVTYTIPTVSETGWGQQVTAYLVALSQASVSTSFTQNVRTSTSGSTTVLPSDFMILVNVAGPATVTLPTGVRGQMYGVFDVSGAAYTNHITVATTGGQLIDNQTTYSIQSNYGGLIVQFDGTRWKIIGEYLNDQITHKNNVTNASFIDAAITTRTAVATATNLQSCTASFDGTNDMTIAVGLDSGSSMILHANFLSANITAFSDNSGIFLPSDSGTGIVVTKPASSRVITFKNRMGGSENIEIKSLTSRIVSATVWS